MAKNLPKAFPPAGCEQIIVYGLEYQAERDTYGKGCMNMGGEC